jgi:acetyltransferase-like isoleucine patch superfamily enzyme
MTTTVAALCHRLHGVPGESAPDGLFTAARRKVAGGHGDVKAFGRRMAGEAIHRSWERIALYGAIGPDTLRGRRFGKFGQGSVICFPKNTIFNEQYIHIGEGTMIGPHVTLSAGMMPGQVCVTDPVVRIGDRCLIGKGSGIVGHLTIDIGDDVWTGHNVYITDQNHGYDDLSRPISQQSMPERAVTIGDGSWLGYGTVVLPGARIGRHVTVGANSVVIGELPDNCVAGGSPARVLRDYREGEGWLRTSTR